MALLEAARTRAEREQWEGEARKDGRQVARARAAVPYPPQQGAGVACRAPKDAFGAEAESNAEERDPAGSAARARAQRRRTPACSISAGAQSPLLLSGGPTWLFERHLRGGKAAESVLELSPPARESTVHGAVVRASEAR